MRSRTGSVTQWTSDLYSYVDQPNSNLLCCICQFPFVEPTTTRTCAHTFCRSCILHALETSSHCPIDRSPLTPEKLGPATPIIRDMVDELIVRCNNEAKGCPARVQRQLLKAHIREDCQYTHIPCPDPQCGSSAQRRHTQSGQCTHSQSITGPEDVTPIASTSTTCMDCSKHLPSHEALVAHASECASCPHMVHGCSWRGRVDELNDQHLNACPYRRLSGFFDINDSRATRLEEENRALRMRLEATEGLVHTLLGDMAVLKSALGPFLHDTQERPVLEVTPFPSSPLGSPPIQQDQPSTSPPNSVDIASYFPPALPYNPAPANVFTSTAASPSIPSAPYTGSNRTERSSPSQPLYAHISGIANSLEALVREQEAYRRETDAAHAQLGNEVGALRATVGGLRMYVSELSSTVGALVAERGGLSEDGSGLSGPAGHPLPWLGRAFGPPSYGPGYPHSGPLAPPFALSSPPSVPVKL